MADIRAVRILVECEQSLRSVCKIFFTANDASVYLVPYAAHGRYFYGGRSLGEQQVEDTFDFTTQLSSGDVPTLSIHQSGQVHVKVGAVRAGPLHIPQLTKLRGEHVATVCLDVFDGLPEHLGALEAEGSELDHVIPVETGVESGRLAMYVNGIEASFRCPQCRLMIRLVRSSLPQPVYIGLAPKAQLPLGSGPRRGVTVIAGWDPTLPTGAPQDYLYLRGE